MMIDENKEIEYAVIGSFFKWFDELKDKRNLVSRDDFSDDALKGLFDVIAEVPLSADSTILIADVPRDLRATAMETVNYAISLHSFSSYVSRLMQMSQTRRLNSKILTLSLSGDVTLNDIKDILDSEQEHDRSFSYAEKAVSNIDKFSANVGRKQRRISTGFSRIDAIICGLRIPAVSIVGATPGTGKTAFALNVISSQKSPVVFFSLEMSSHMIFERLVSDRLSINYQRFSSQNLTEEQSAQARDYVKSLKNRVYVFDDVFSVEQQAAIINSIKPELVVVDYIQKVRTSTSKATDRRNELEYISGQYKQIALYNNCHIMLLSQLRRSDKAMPTMTDLKESGALEADGDYILLLNRPYIANKKLNPQETKLLIDKNKFGGTGDISLSFEGKYQRFVSIDTCYGEENAPKPRQVQFTDKQDDIDLDSDLPF